MCCINVLLTYFYFLLTVGRFGGVQQRLSDVERLLCEHGTDMGRVWSTVDLRSFLLPLPLARRLEHYAVIDHR